MEIQKAINKLCTAGSVFLLIRKTCYDCIVNGMGFKESFIGDPGGYIFTLLPIIINVFILLYNSFVNNCEFSDIVVFFLMSVTILTGVIFEFIVIQKYTLYNIPISDGDIGKWYMGIGIVILIILIEGIIIECMNGGDLDGVLDYMLDGLPYHYYLFCIILGLQKTIIKYPYLWETHTIENIFHLIFSTIIYSILYFIGILFAVALLWLKKLF